MLVMERRVLSELDERWWKEVFEGLAVDRLRAVQKLVEEEIVWREQVGLRGGVE